MSLINKSGVVKLRKVVHFEDELTSLKALGNPLLDKLLKEEENEIIELESLVDKDGNPMYRDLRRIYNFYQPTAEDLMRSYTEEELKELCLRVKCRVNMQFFNPVEDAAKRLRREGRLQNRSRSHINRLLTKAVMKHNRRALYTQEEIDNYRNLMWRERKKANNLLLNLWKDQREKIILQNIVELSQIETPIHYEETCDVQNFTPTVEVSTENNTFQNEESEIILRNGNESFVKSVEDGEIEEWDTTQENGSAIQNCEDLNAIFVVESPPQLQSSDSEISISSQLNVEVIEAGLQVNTESININTEELLSESEEILSNEPQPENLPYEVFNTQVPSTSTQSQHTQDALS